MKNIGLNWYKCDFHLHTMISRCYKESDTEEEWVKAVKKRDLDCIAITDHNDYRGIDKIKQLCNKEGIVAFPGVELSSDTSKVHLLVLFDPSCDSNVVRAILTQLEITEDKLGDSKSTCVGTIFTTCKKACKNKALVIAAHIDEFNGLCEISHDNIREVLEENYVNAVQIVNEEIWDVYERDHNLEQVCDLLTEKYGKEISSDRAKKWYSAYSLAKEVGIPMLKFSDNPYSMTSSKHGLWGIGKEYTWLKMKQKPDLESVRQALLSYDMRVKVNTVPEPEPDIWIKSIKIANSYLNEKTPIYIEFNPQLNTIIGGRGSGKSSIIRTIAGILRSFEKSKADMILQEQEDFYKKKDMKNKKGIFKDQSSAEIVFVRNNELYKIETTNIKDMDQQIRKIYRHVDSLEEWIEVEDNNYFNFFSAQIFTQKQIYEIARDVNSILNIIDEAIDKLPNLIEKREQNLNAVISKKVELWNVEKKIEQESKIKTELQDINSQIDKYKKSGISDALKEKQQFDMENHTIREFFKRVDESIDKFNESINQMFLQINELPQIQDDEIKLIFSEFNEMTSKSKTEIMDIIQSVSKHTKEVQEKIFSSKWNQKSKNATDKYTATCEHLANQGVLIDKLDNLLEQKEKKYYELKQIEEYKKERQNLQKELQEAQEMYKAAAYSIYQKRKEFIYAIIGGNPTVKFEIKQARNKDSFVKMMISLFGKENMTIRDNVMKMQEIFFEKNGKEKFVESVCKIRNKTDTSSYSKKIRDMIIDMPMESFARMISFVADDDVVVSYKPEKAKSYISLSNASAGQKTTAILTFLLAFGKNPLILDQPEDDLDNKLVYDLIVTRLKEAKKKRQIIIVTHNANIPVNGDAEYIVAMDSETDKIQVREKGTMDDESIRKEICDVMEGTQYAFEMRAKKYHFEIKE